MSDLEKSTTINNLACGKWHLNYTPNSRAKGYCSAVLRQISGRAKRKHRGIDYSGFPLAKVVRVPSDILHKRDGRIVFNRRTEAGKALYQRATFLMAERQNWFCSLCGERMNFDEISFEHGNLRGLGGGLRTDDPYALDEEGFYMNSAVHGSCNSQKGSRRDYPLAMRLRPSEGGKA